MYCEPTHFVFSGRFRLNDVSPASSVSPFHCGKLMLHAYVCSVTQGFRAFLRMTATIPLYSSVHTGTDGHRLVSTWKGLCFDNPRRGPSAKRPNQGDCDTLWHRDVHSRSLVSRSEAGLALRLPPGSGCSPGSVPSTRRRPRGRLRVPRGLRVGQGCSRSLRSAPSPRPHWSSHSLASVMSPERRPSCTQSSLTCAGSFR